MLIVEPVYYYISCQSCLEGVEVRIEGILGILP
jgi:hypothetical protein